MTWSQRCFVSVFEYGQFYGWHTQGVRAALLLRERIRRQGQKMPGLADTVFPNAARLPLMSAVRQRKYPEGL